MADNGRVPDQPAAPDAVDGEASAVADPAADDAADVGSGGAADVRPAEPEPPGAGDEQPAGLTDEEWAQVAEQRDDRQKRRMRQNVRDMLLSLAVVGVLVVFFAAPWNWLAAQDPVREVDWVPVVTGAQEAYDWPVLAPVGLSAGWRATSARIEVADDGEPVVVVGWLDPSEEYVGLQQSTTRITDFVDTVTLDGAESGTVVIGGVTWTRYVNEEQTRRSLARTEGPAVYVVTGTGDWASIEAFTAKLRAG